MIKVVEIIPSMSLRGGAEVFFYNFCIEMKKNPDVDLSIIVLYDSIHNSFNFSNFDNVYFCHKKNKFDLNCSKTIRQVINKIQPDIVHTHLSCTIPYVLAFGFKKQHWVMFHTLHSIPKKESPWFTRLLIRKLYKKRNFLIGISNQITNESKKIYKNSNILTIYNGFKLKFSCSTLANKKNDFICVARFSPVKNHKLLFDAFNDLYISGLTKQKLICVGGGELLAHYQQYVDKLQCKNNIIFTGYLNDVENELACSKIFILTSFYEGNPISILEAMSYGLPIIAPRVGGIPDIVEDGINGFLFEVNNKNDLVDKIKTIVALNDIEIIEKRNITKSKSFSIENCVNEYLIKFKECRCEKM